MWFVLAAGAAFCFGVRGILYHWTAQRPVDRNMLLFAVYLSGTLITVAVNSYVGEPWNAGVWTGALVGFFSFVANAAMYKGYAVGRASVVALFTGLPPVVVVALAYLLWGETLAAMQFAGFFAVIAGLLIIRYGNDLKLGQFRGWQWGLVTMIFFGATDTAAKQATLVGASILPTLTMMYATGSLLFALMYAGSRRTARTKREEPGQGAAAEAGAVAGTGASAQEVAETGASAQAVTAKQWSAPRTLAWGLVVGITNVAGMMLLMPAFRDGVTGIVSAISATNLVFVLLYARLYLKEKMSRQEALGMLLALLGIAVLRLAS